MRGLNRGMVRACGLLAGGWLAVSPARGEFVSGSDGSDGALNVTANTVIDLRLAADGDWDTPSPVAGQGVYDAEQWAVVFKYSTINIAAGATVTFINHRSGAPVVWLATGDVTIGGTIDIRGANGQLENTVPVAFAEPGPGGFAGGQNAIGQSTTVSRGFGPGASPNEGGGGVYADWGPSCSNPGSTYGNAEVFPLMGGSGGNAFNSLNGAGGGAGGGAILIASSARISLPAGGSIIAIGGSPAPQRNAGGSGGAIRLMAQESILGAGSLYAYGGTASSAYCSGGSGRIRLEAPDVNIPFGNMSPSPSQSLAPVVVFPDTNLAPTLWVTQVDAALAPLDPAAGIKTADVTISTDAPSVIHIRARNIPAGRTVQVRAVPERGPFITATSTGLLDAGGGELTATATLPTRLPAGLNEIQLRVNW